MATNDEWLRRLAAMNKGPLELRAGRHEAFALTLNLSGNFTGAALVGHIRLYPDAPGDPLVAFTVSAFGAFAAGVTPVTISLTEAQLEDPTKIPAAPAGEGEVTLVYDLLLTPSGGSRERLFGGTFIVVGGSTNVA